MTFPVSSPAHFAKCSGLRIVDMISEGLVVQRCVLRACHPRLAVSVLVMHNGLYAVAYPGGEGKRFLHACTCRAPRYRMIVTAHLGPCFPLLFYKPDERPIDIIRLKTIQIAHPCSFLSLSLTP